MPADWELDDEAAKIEEANRWNDAKLAAKLVINGYERNSAVSIIKEVNANQEQYKHDPGVYIEDDETQGSQFTAEQCNYPSAINGEFDPQRVHQIAKELFNKF